MGTTYKMTKFLAMVFRVRLPQGGYTMTTGQRSTPAGGATSRRWTSTLDCALWGLRHSHAEDGDYRGTVHVLLAADAATRHPPPTGDEAIDADLTAHGIS